MSGIVGRRKRTDGNERLLGSVASSIQLVPFRWCAAVYETISFAIDFLDLLRKLSLLDSMSKLTFSKKGA